MEITPEEIDEFPERQITVRKSLMVRLVLATGLVADERQAQYVLLGIAIVGFVLGGVVMLAGSGAPKGLTNTDVQRITQLQLETQHSPQ